MHNSVSPLLTVAVAMTAFGILTAPVMAQETGADIPKNSYYKDPLTKAERNAIAEEEDVSPNDGSASVPAQQDQGVIPDAADKADSTNVGTPDAAKQGAQKKTAESEADIILDQSKKNDKVTKEDMANCMKDWDPQSQMSKAEWKESCRTTLEYFPDGQ
jgi:hypothetical protein